MATSAARTANPMDEAFCHFGQVVIDDVSDVLHVDAAGSDVGGNQYAEASLLKCRKCCTALRLRAISVDHRGLDALANQVLGNPFGAALGAREDQRTASLFGQQAVQHIGLAVDGDFISVQLDVFRRLVVEPNDKRTALRV